MSRLEELVDKQAEDEGLWFIANTATEAYLQQELRKLHAAVEEHFKRKNPKKLTKKVLYFEGEEYDMNPPPEDE